MIEKSLIIIIFLYSASFTLIAVQYTIADPLHITLFGSQQLGSSSVLVNTNLSQGLIQVSCITASSNCSHNLVDQDANATLTSRASIVNNPIVAAAGMAWTLIEIIFGAYIFNILILLGVPAVFVNGLVLVYFFLVIRAVVGYVRGI